MLGTGLGSNPTRECGIFSSLTSLNLDGNSDIMPEETPGPGGCWEIDAAGDIMPEAV